MRTHNFKFLAFTTEWKYYFWIGKYQLKCVFANFSLNYHNVSIFPYMSINVTSRGETVPRGMGIQYPRANILGDMSNYMNNSDSFI